MKRLPGWNSRLLSSTRRYHMVPPSEKNWYHAVPMSRGKHRGDPNYRFNFQTAGRYARSISRHELPETCATFRPPERQRAQGKPGARCTRGLVCKMHNEMRTRAYRFSGGNPAFPARWFTAYFVLSPVTGFVA